MILGAEKQIFANRQLDFLNFSLFNKIIKNKLFGEKYRISSRKKLIFKSAINNWDSI